MFMTPASEFESPLHRTALAQLDSIAERLNFEPGIHERLRYPRRALTVSIPVLMDDERTEVFIGDVGRDEAAHVRGCGCARRSHREAVPEAVQLRRTP